MKNTLLAMTFPQLFVLNAGRQLVGVLSDDNSNSPAKNGRRLNSEEVRRRPVRRCWDRLEADACTYLNQTWTGGRRDLAVIA
jgi:hypothetical protein